MFTKTNQYNALTSWYTKAHKSKSPKLIQAEVNELWHSLKQSKSGPVDIDRYNVELDKLKSRVKRLEGSQTSIYSFLKTKPAIDNSEKVGIEMNNNVIDVEPIVGPSSNKKKDAVAEVLDESMADEEAGAGEIDREKKGCDDEIEFKTPVQDKLKTDILEKEAALGKLLDAKRLGLESETTDKINKRIKVLKQDIEAKKKELKRKVTNQIAVKKVCCLPIGCSKQHSFGVPFATL